MLSAKPGYIDWKIMLWLKTLTTVRFNGKHYLTTMCTMCVNDIIVNNQHVSCSIGWKISVDSNSKRMLTANDLSVSSCLEQSITNNGAFVSN